jgi:hypothetical protein
MTRRFHYEYRYICKNAMSLDAGIYVWYEYCTVSLLVHTQHVLLVREPSKTYGISY